jgi:hypothetical protein
MRRGQRRGGADFHVEPTSCDARERKRKMRVASFRATREFRKRGPQNGKNTLSRSCRSAAFSEQESFSATVCVYACCMRAVCARVCMRVCAWPRKCCCCERPCELSAARVRESGRQRERVCGVCFRRRSGGRDVARLEGRGSGSCARERGRDCECGGGGGPPSREAFYM